MDIKKIDIYADIREVEVFYTWKPCTSAKRRPGKYIARDVRRFLLDGLLEMIYKETKHKFLEISLIVVR